MASKLCLKAFTSGISVSSKGLGVGGFLRLPSGSRTLFTAEAIGVENYEKQRSRTQTQFTGMVDKFRDKMKEFTFSDTKNMIFTEDLKHMVHLVENRPEDLTLIHQMMKRFNSQNRHLRFGNFVFGPVVMRMYYYLNQPTLALEAFQDPELEGFFDGITTYQILCDLLYNHEMYQEILTVFDKVKNKQVQGIKYPRQVVILVLAACYKLNTVQSYEYALQLLNDMKDFGSEPVRRAIAYAGALAINQNAPQVALEILTSTRQGNYVTIRNLKLLALAELNRPDDCLPILRYSIEFDSPEAVKRQSVCQEVLDKIKLSVERLGDKEVTLEFQRICKALAEANQVESCKLGEFLETEIAATAPPGTAAPGFGIQMKRNTERSFRMGRNDLRPQRSPVYKMELRQGITHD